MKTIHVIGLTAVAVLAIAFAFALGAYTASHKTRDDRQDEVTKSVQADVAAVKQQVSKLQFDLSSLERRLGRGQGASQ